MEQIVTRAKLLGQDLINMRIDHLEIQTKNKEKKQKEV